MFYCAPWTEFSKLKYPKAIIGRSLNRRHWKMERSDRELSEPVSSKRVDDWQNFLAEKYSKLVILSEVVK